MLRRFSISVSFAALCIIALPAWSGDPVTIKSSGSEINIDAVGGFPVRWVVCAPDCRDDARSAELFGRGLGAGFFVPVVPGDENETRYLQQLEYSAELAQDEDSVTLVLNTDANPAGLALTQRYTFSKASRRIQVELQLPPGGAIEFSTGVEFIPEQLPGFASMYGVVRAVRIVDGEQITLEPEESETLAFDAASDEWVGIRNRFWAGMIQSRGDGVRVELEESQPNQPRLRLQPSVKGEALRLQLYAGPVEWAELRSASPELSVMLFAALWDWLRALCFGLLMLLTGLHSVVGNYGLAIVLLSLSVKILMWPLTYVADRWQQGVNRTQTLLKPQLDQIKATFKGEEAHHRTLAVYKEHGVHPLFTFKSMAGFLIQIPIFIAAFDMLGENFALGETSFLWIDDLSKPDRWATLPWSIPFAGAYLNLLPFVMTAFTLLAAWMQRDDSLSPDLQRQQAKRLYLMAGAFFVLLYTFPAGMVLYWTSSNLFHLIKIHGSRLIAAAQGGN